MENSTTKYTIATIGNPILREVAAEVVDFSSQDLQQFIDDLINTVIDENGVGIAAPQVSVSKQIMIIASRPNARYPTAPEMEPTALINPKIIEYSQELEKGWEGCLSVPGIRGLVPRYTWVDVRYQDRQGECLEARFEGFVARIFQHEYDHLIGNTYLDRLESNRDIISEEEYQIRLSK